MLLLANKGVAQIIDVEEKKEEDRRGSSILDDTTKQIYGPTTTRYYFEHNVKYNRPEFNIVDTSIINLHRFHFVPFSGFTYQDLGNIGTALNPIFTDLPEQIGATSGFTLYDPYYNGTNDIRYYDTKSPFSKFRIIWGGQGRAITEAQYTRNINERINFGFRYRGYFIDKQIEREGRGDRAVEGTYYVLHGSLISKNGRYRALAYFNRNKHDVQEYGGIQSATGQPDDPEFFDENRQITLRQAETVELRTNYHLYHQYTIGKIAQLYHSFDRYKQQNDFNNEVLDSINFAEVVIDSVPVRDRSKIITTVNEIGIKGDAGKTFYSFYYKARLINFDYKYLLESEIPFETDYLESFGGFNIRFGNDSLSYIETFGEYQLKGNYRLGGRLKNSWFLTRRIARRSTMLKAGFTIPLGKTFIEPDVFYTLHSNYIYFQEELQVRETTQPGVLDTLGYQARPFQAGGDISVLGTQVGFQVNFLKHLSFKTLIRLTNVSGSSADAIRVPEVFTVTQLAYHNIFFNGNLEVQTGIDLHWQTDYYAMGYDPAIMQYFVQDRFEVYSYPIFDIFVNAKINRGKVFLKLNNVYDLISGEGYFATPYYPGQTTILDFGVDWAFYD